ncbi:hypothetical protein EDB85DRAFT_1896513 [Lactarius pseudohatsudake]|nr:hypothetical protein EDB85DRAFT_1896513 [Lactarius pseudohatsudake]
MGHAVALVVVIVAVIAIIVTVVVVVAIMAVVAVAVGCLSSGRHAVVVLADCHTMAAAVVVVVAVVISMVVVGVDSVGRRGRSVQVGDNRSRGGSATCQIWMNRNRKSSQARRTATEVHGTGLLNTIRTLAIKIQASGARIEYFNELQIQCGVSIPLKIPLHSNVRWGTAHAMLDRAHKIRQATADAM